MCAQAVRTIERGGLIGGLWQEGQFAPEKTVWVQDAES